MSASVTATTAMPQLPWRQRLENFRVIPRVETYPSIVAFARTFAGKLVLLGLFSLGLWVATEDWLPISVSLAVITFFPAHRRLLVTIATLVCTFLVPWSKYPHPVYTSALVVFTMAIGAILFWICIEAPNSLLGRHPMPVLLCGYSLLLAFAAWFPNNSRFYLTVWDFTATFGLYLWFIAYSLLDSRSASRDNFSLQLGTYRPFWGLSVVPIPKGAQYLRRIEAKDAEQLAVVQLKGLKLLAWSLIVSYALKGFTQLAHGYLAIPTMPAEFICSVNRAPDPWYVCWLSLICEFLEATLFISVWGHRLIACCRMAGFNALRNTYRPLSSRSIAEFWNRYYFYFKELLVDVFFYPVFLNFFKKNKKLRLAVATFAAAGFGNAFYHFVAAPQYISRLGLWGAIASFHVYIFYCVVLATAIAISQMRRRPASASGFIRGHLAPSVCVVLFYCVLHVFDCPPQRVYPIWEHFRFIAHLFNLV